MSSTVGGISRPGLTSAPVAAVHNFITAGVEHEVFGPQRRELLPSAGGRVLDVGAGTGANLAHFPSASG